MDATHRAINAIRNDDAPALRALLAERPDLALSTGDGGLTVLMTALYFQRRELVALLAACAAPLPLFEAAALNRADRVRELIAAGVDPNGPAADGMGALHLAAFFNAPDVVRLLLEAGADVNRVADNTTRVRPLHSALAGRSAQIVEMLVRGGADVDARQQAGWTALQAAAKNGLLDVVDLLLAAGASRHLTADNGKTAYDLATEAGQTAVAERLRPG